MFSNYINVFIVILFSAFLAACSSFSLKLASPFKVVSEKDKQDMYLVVVTRAIYKPDPDNADKFQLLTNNVLDNIEIAPGLYGYSVRKDFFGNTAWTYTIWENHSDMGQFKVSEFHTTAMQSAPTVLLEAKFARTFISPKELNYSWDKALALLEEEGRVYRFGDASKSNTDSSPESSD